MPQVSSMTIVGLLLMIAFAHAYRSGIFGSLWNAIAGN